MGGKGVSSRRGGGKGARRDGRTDGETVCVRACERARTKAPASQDRACYAGPAAAHKLENARLFCVSRP
jgi:hypothetical protein